MAIREDKGRILLTGLHQIDIKSVDDLLGALNFGSSIRQTDATAINAKSSRSHAVFSINLVQRTNKAAPAGREKRFSVPIEAMSGTEDWITVDSKLHFVDLAGSERLKNTGASGDRAREGISINAGLASLGKVISQLSTRQAGTHISYRDSRLTRLLQDSLGGNAITYMIACVTPAEFHLSETLNTVQYAQRARAIQSKPQIQQTSGESDKQAVIDRLRAEVSFLRDQIRNTERGTSAPLERLERQNEREVELQNHLLDVQESYGSLSQRHAKLISEITKARDTVSGEETPTLSEVIGDSAVERLKRSNSFAEAVEQVVLEYEKTIQSLENSLSNTRSTLASTESTLLEKENRCAYVETINQQLQDRVHKLIDRDADNEQYLHNLEAKLDGQSSGDEKSAALVLELRKEIARTRANEAQCEDYISTLEERLAEADQDMELKQRELDRLEQVVERQRSLGKLDKLLYEFDHLQSNGKMEEPQLAPKPLTNGISKHTAIPKSLLQQAVETAIPESDDDDDDTTIRPLPNGPAGRTDHTTAGSRDTSTPRARPVQSSVAISREDERQSPAQSRMVADKLEDVNQELFDLRIQHESTVTDLGMMSAKYEEALRTLAAMQDAVDEARHEARRSGEPQSATSPTISTRPTSFLGDARVNELKDGGHVPSSRSLSSELSLAGDSNTSLDQSIDESPQKRVLSGDLRRTSQREDSLLLEIEALKRAQAEKDEGIQTLNARYTDLQEQHGETLDVVEELKAEVQKAKMRSPTSPNSPVIKRKSSQNVMTIDRAHRSFASLRNIAADNLEDKPDTMQSFEINLNTAMHELHQRSERVQLLEAELLTLKKDMETKATMISGLTRERSSLKTSSPIDMSVVSTIHGQLLQNENQTKMLQEQHAIREQELLAENSSLKQSLEQAEAAKSAMPGFFPETPATSYESNDKQLGVGYVPPQEVARLQGEVSQWQQKHNAAVSSMQISEKRLIATVTDLEASMASVKAMREEADEKARQSESMSANAASLEHEKLDHVHMIGSLKREIDEHNTTIGSHVDNIKRLEQLQIVAQEQQNEATRFRSDTESTLELHRQHISTLEQQILESQSDVEFHKHGLKSLHDSHAREIDGLRSTIDNHVAGKAGMERKLEEMKGVYTSQITRLETEVIDLKDQLEKARIGLANEVRQSKAACDELEAQRNQLQEEVNNLKTEIATAAKSNEEKIAEMESIKAEKDRAASLVDELEEQLHASFDQQQANNSRLSILSNSQAHNSSHSNIAISVLEKQLEASQKQVEQLQVWHVSFPLKRRALTLFSPKCAEACNQIRPNATPPPSVRAQRSLPCHHPRQLSHFLHYQPPSHRQYRPIFHSQLHNTLSIPKSSLPTTPLSKKRTPTSDKWKSISSPRNN